MSITELAPPPAPAEPAVARLRGRRWAALSVSLIIIGALLSPVAIVANWAKLQISDTSTFVSTFGPLASNPNVQDFVTTQVVATIDQQIDIDKLTTAAFDSLTSGLTPDHAAALNALKGVTADGIRSVIQTAVARFVSSDAFAVVWRQALLTSHTQLVAALQNDPNAAISLGSDGQVGIQLGPIVAEVKQNLVSNGVTFASGIPTVDKTIVLAQSDAVVKAQAAYALAVALGLWLPWIVLLIFAAAVLVARKRLLALIWAAIALTVSMTVVLTGVAVGHSIFDSLVSSVATTGFADALYSQILDLVRSTTTAVAVLAATVAVVAWLASPYALPRSIRSAAASAATSIRTGAGRHGFSTGRFGERLFVLRRPVNIAVAIIAASIVLFVRPLTPAVIIWTAILALVVLALIELIQRPQTAIVPSEIDSDKPQPVHNRLV